MTMTLALGALIGMISGYFGGRINGLIQRTVELLLAFPRIPLWMALAAAVPKNCSPLLIYFMITLILAVVSWGASCGRSAAWCCRYGTGISSSPP